MRKNAEANEHILVCLSPSPSNPKVVAAAARMAEAFQASLTAIYIKPTTYDTLSDKDKIRVQDNICFAEQNGAFVTTIIGDDVPAQVAEYAHISGATKIVVGRSGIGRHYIWSKPTLKESVYTLFLLMAATVIGLLFTHLGFSESNIITVFILGVLVISVVTINPLYSVVGSLISVLLFNWFFIDTKFSFHTYKTEYAVTFAIMLVSSLITGTLANRMKQNARQSAREAFRTKVLLDTSQLLQKAENSAEVIQTTARQITTLLNRDVVFYSRSDVGPEAGQKFLGSWSAGRTRSQDVNEKEIVEWVFSNQRSAGSRMEQYPTAKSQYHPICLNDYCYGVIAVRLDHIHLEPFENSIVISILGECALALESIRNAAEKERVSAMVRSEQLRSDLLRSISHDIRTPLTSISGNASNLLFHYRQLDDETREQIFSGIFDDSEWLIDLV